MRYTRTTLASTGLLVFRPAGIYVRAEPRRTGRHRLDHHSPKTAGPPEILIPSLHPGVQDPGSARLIEVAVGAKITGVDVVIPRSRTVPVKGRLVLAPGLRFNGVYLKYAGDNDDLGISLQAKWTPDGNFEFGAVPPGSYILTAVANPPAKPASDRVAYLLFYQSQYRAQIPVQVDSLPVDGLRVVIDAGADVEGLVRVVDDKETKITGRTTVLLTMAWDKPPLRWSVTTVSSLTVFCPGHYHVSLRHSVRLHRSKHPGGREGHSRRRPHDFRAR